MEAKQSNGCIDCRPDLCITKSCGVKWGTDCGYGEAKPVAWDNDHCLMCIDLAGVIVLSKGALNKQCLDGILGIQLVGRTIMFYVLLLPAEGIYTLLQLVGVKTPDSLQSLSHFVMDMSNILSYDGRLWSPVCVLQWHTDYHWLQDVHRKFVCVSTIIFCIKRSKATMPSQMSI